MDPLNDPFSREFRESGIPYTPDDRDGDGNWPTKIIASIIVVAAIILAMYGVGKVAIAFGHAPWWEFSARGEDAPKTNGERGMLRYDDAFGTTPKIRLCEIEENGIVRLQSCPVKPVKR